MASEKVAQLLGGHMHSIWNAENRLPWWGGPCLAVILALPAVTVGSGLYHQLDGRICKGVGELDPSSYEYVKKLEQCIRDGKAVPGK